MIEKHLSSKMYKDHVIPKEFAEDLYKLVKFFNHKYYCFQTWVLDELDGRKTIMNIYLRAFRDRK